MVNTVVTPDAVSSQKTRKNTLKTSPQELRNQRDQLMRERDALILFLTKILPSHLATDLTAPIGLQTIVCAHAPTGEMAWRILDDEKAAFSFLPTGDEHLKALEQEKYQRLLDLQVNDFATTVALHPESGVILRFHCPLRVNVIPIDSFDRTYKRGGGLNSN